MGKIANGRLPDERMRKWLRRALNNADIGSIEPLPGGASTSLFRIHTGRDTFYVLRMYDNEEWLRQEPDLPLHEAAALERAGRTGIPVPELVVLEPDPEPLGVPALLMTGLPGRVELAAEPEQSGVPALSEVPELSTTGLPGKQELSRRQERMDEWLSGLADTMVRFHQASARDVTSFPWGYFTYNRVDELITPSWSEQPELWEKALETVRRPPPAGSRTCFIHRDFHPANVLWQDGRVSGVVDWVNACIGSPGIDVGHCRLNLALLHGAEAADGFLRRYLELAGEDFCYEPYWDLLALIQFLPGPPAMYQGWIDLGVPPIQPARLTRRYESLLSGIVGKLRD